MGKNRIQESNNKKVMADPDTPQQRLQGVMNGGSNPTSLASVAAASVGNATTTSICGTPNKATTASASTPTSLHKPNIKSSIENEQESGIAQTPRMTPQIETPTRKTQTTH